MNEGPYTPDQPPTQPPAGGPPPTPPAPPPPPVSVGGGEPLAAPEPPPPRRKRTGLIVGLVAALVVIGGLAFGAVKIFNTVAGTSDVLAKMVPVDADVYMTAYLDPSASQKLNLRNLANKFPSAGSGGGSLSSTLDQTLEQALSQTGLSYIHDIKPWLGTQLAVAVHLGGRVPEAAVLISSKDDAKALSTIRQARDKLLGDSGLTWRTESHGGITVNIGSDPSGARQVAYALVDHTVVLANAGVLVEQVIDAAQGHGSNLGDNDSYRATVDGLPKDVLGLAYVNPSLIAQLPGLASGLPIGGPAGLPSGFPTALPSGFPSGGHISGVTGPFPTTTLPIVLPTAVPQLSAFKGLGLALSAQSNGLALDLTVALDSSKLSGPEKEALTSGAHENAVLAFVPKDAYGMFALTGFQKLAQSLVDQLGTLDPNVKQITDQIGLTTNVLGDLTGDIGVEVEPGTGGGPPSGALLIGTKNESGTQAFLDHLATFISKQSSQSGQPVTFQSTSYKGVTIKVATGPGLGPTDIQPAYAVTAGMGIVGETPDAVKAVIDAHGGSSITAAPNFSETFSQLEQSNNALFYVDVEAILSKLVPPGTFPPEVESNLSRLKAAALDVTSSPDHVNTRLFFLIK